mgnify:CR=1 FL=1
MVRQPASSSMRGIVYAAAGLDKFSLSRFEPGPRTKDFVDHYWAVRYDLPAGMSYTQTVLSYPNVHLAFEQDEAGRRALVYGIPRRPFVRELKGAGRVLGVRFRAGGFFPWWRNDVALLTGRTVAASEVFGKDADGWADAVLDAGEKGDDAAMAQVAEAIVSARLPDPDARVELAARIVREAMEDREIVKVEQLAERFEMAVRQLQRLFRRYVGVSPKWVIKRFRLQEAAELLEQDASTSLTELAARLGYFDQAHFIKDFKAVLGRTPEEHRAGPGAAGSPGEDMRA